MVMCHHCNNEIISKYAKIFCDHSCAARHNNKGVRRHGKPATNCNICGKKTASSYNKYCSHKCMGIGRTKYTKEQKRKLNCQNVMKYRARKYAQTPSDADRVKIREIYLNRPADHHVDHIIPLSRGGLHHQDNLQYLTKEDNWKKNNRM